MRVAPLALLAVLVLSGCFGGLGKSATAPGDFLTSQTYSRWVIEVDSSAGSQPSGALTKFLHDRLAPLVNKESVEIQIGESFPAADTAWSDSDLQSFASKHQNVQTEGTTVSLHLLFLSGHYDKDSSNGKVLGVTYGHDLIVIFSDSIKATCTLPAPVCTTDVYFQAVLIHEFGHALGLVNNGVPMVRNHEATTCGNSADVHHSINQNSVMYCQVESSAITLLSSPPTNFDADDKADLKAAGGR